MQTPLQVFKEETVPGAEGEELGRLGGRPWALLRSLPDVEVSVGVETGEIRTPSLSIGSSRVMVVLVYTWLSRTGCLESS
jgi:hypothetical protein